MSTISSKPRANGKEQRRVEAEERQIRSKERKEREEKVAGIEAEILRLETRQKELTTLLEDPATYAAGNVVGLNRELAGVTEALEAINREWESFSIQHF